MGSRRAVSDRGVEVGDLAWVVRVVDVEDAQPRRVPRHEQQAGVVGVVDREVVAHVEEQVAVAVHLACAVGQGVDLEVDRRHLDRMALVGDVDEARVAAGAVGLFGADDVGAAGDARPSFGVLASAGQLPKDPHGRVRSTEVQIGDVDHAHTTRGVAHLCRGAEGGRRRRGVAVVRRVPADIGTRAVRADVEVVARILEAPAEEQFGMPGIGEVDHGGARPRGDGPGRAVADVGRVIQGAVGGELARVDPRRAVGRARIVKRSRRRPDVVVREMDRMPAVPPEVVDADHRPDRHDEDPALLVGVETLVDAEEGSSLAGPRAADEHRGHAGRLRLRDVQHRDAVAGVGAFVARLVGALLVPGELDVAATTTEIVGRDRPEVAAVALPRRTGDLVDRRNLSLDSRFGPIATTALFGRAFCCSRSRGSGRNCSRIAEGGDGERGDEKRAGRTHHPRFPAGGARTCLCYLGRRNPTDKVGAVAVVAQLVERDLAKVEVAGSSPVYRSRAKGSQPRAGSPSSLRASADQSRARGRTPPSPRPCRRSASSSACRRSQGRWR